MREKNIIKFCSRQDKHTDLGEEFSDNAFKVAKADVLIGDPTFNLVEFSKMCSVESFVSEDTIN